MSKKELQEWRLERHRGFISTDSLWLIGYTAIIVTGLLALVYTH